MPLVESSITNKTKDFYQEQLTRRVPTVFIGLGGSGREVLMRLRKRFFDRFRTKDPGFSQFVFVDTDMQGFTPRGEIPETYAELAPDPTEVVTAPITPDQFRKTFQDLKANVNADHLSWLKPELENITDQSVQNGSGSYRPMGRLAFFLNYHAIRETIERQLKAVLKFAAEHFSTVEENRVEVVIVMSLAGGTGSGMFIDVAYLVQDLLNKLGQRSLRSRTVTLVGFMPSAFAEEQRPLLDRLQQNAFAALLELEHYGTSITGEELFLGEIADGKRYRESRSGFLVNWGDGAKHFIRGQGWDTCFLIDNRNDLNPNLPLMMGEVFQMTADYLFLDFQASQLAIAKRSARHNILQFKDRIKETWIRRPDDSQEGNTLRVENEAVFAFRYSCRYSSFGLSEIHFDVEKLYQIAAYRLASRLVRSRWIGSADQFPDLVYKNWTREQLLQPKADAGERVPPSFLPEALIRRLLTLPSSDSHFDILKRELEFLAEFEPELGLERLKAILARNAAALREGTWDETGATLRTLQENAAKYSGDPQILGPLRTRLKQAASRHFARFGSAVTLRLLMEFRNAFNKIREQAVRLSKASSTADRVLLSRLIEADLVPWPVHKISLAIEFERATADVYRELKFRHDKAAGSTIDRMSQDFLRYIGGEAQPAYPDLAKHGTLFGQLYRAEQWLKAIAERLEKRFEVNYHESEPRIGGISISRPRVTRRYSISPHWDKKTYDRRIDQALIGHPAIKRAQASTDGFDPEDNFSFDWESFEARFWEEFRRLPVVEVARIESVNDLVEYAFEYAQTTDEGVKLIAEWVADTCKIVLKGAKDAEGRDAGGLELRDEGDGNTIDLLCRDQDWQIVLDKMVRAKASPYFLSDDPMRVSSDFSPAFCNLYSHKAGTSVPSVNNANRIYAKVRDFLAARSVHIPNLAAKSLPEPLPAEDSSIILVREMTSFPLQYYCHLETLRASYEKTTSMIGGPEAAHIDINETREYLPEITYLDLESVALIRDHVTFVMRAIILGAIRWSKDVLRINIPDKYSEMGTEFVLGRRLHGAIRVACENESVRRYLLHVWNDWSIQATPVDWACFYASCRLTWADLSPERDIRQAEVSSPLRNCYQSLLDLTTARLKSTDDGERWHREMASATSDWLTTTPGPLLNCLRRLNPEIPIYQIVADRVAELP